MTTLASDPASIDALALQNMQAAIAASEKQNLDLHDEAGPLALASAMSDFFEILAHVDNDDAYLSHEDLTDFGEYGLQLLDRLAWLNRRLELMDQREPLCRVYAGLALWLARRKVELENLEGVADGFAYVANGVEDQEQLKVLCRQMDEVAQMAADSVVKDQDQQNPWRPWRVLNLNIGIVATRSLDPKLMEQVFDELGRRLPKDMPGFIADGRRRMLGQNIPEAVQEVMDRYAERWPAGPAH